MGDADDKLKLLMGWNIDSNMQILVWIFYFSATFILVIIMLNLLIAFIGDSYEKIIALERENWNFERTNILYDIDIFLGLQKINQINKKYVFVSRIKGNSNDL